MQLTPNSTPSRKVRRSIGEGAGVLFCALLAAVVFGGVWSFFRPAYVAQVDNGQLLIDEIASPSNVEFASFGGFVCGSALLGLLIALLAVRLRSMQGFGALAWIVIVAFCAACTFLLVGELGAELLHPVPQEHGQLLSAGGALEIVPALFPGAAIFVAPLVAGVGYWLAEVVAFFGESDLPATPMR